MSRAGNGNGAYMEHHKLFHQMVLKLNHWNVHMMKYRKLICFRKWKTPREESTISVVVPPSHFDTKVYVDKKCVFRRTEMFCKNLQELDVKHMLGANPWVKQKHILIVAKKNLRLCVKAQ